jgi:hypothetical protein
MVDVAFSPIDRDRKELATFLPLPGIALEKNRGPA